MEENYYILKVIRPIIKAFLESPIIFLMVLKLLLIEGSDLLLIKDARNIWVMAKINTELWWKGKKKTCVFQHSSHLSSDMAFQASPL